MNTPPVPHLDQLAGVVFFFVGCAMGVFYGFHGWRGSVKDVDIKNSPRYKNFLWVLGVAGGIFIADLKAMIPGADKGQLLLLYSIGFLITAAVFICGWALVIWFSFLYKRKFAKESVPPAPFSPVSDYVWYGFSYYRSRYEAAVNEMRESRFEKYKQYIRAYVEQVAVSMAAVEGYKAAEGVGQRNRVAREILRSIRAVVIAYQEKSADMKVNANYMEAISRDSLTQDESTKVRFSFGDPKRYSHFLALRTYAEDVAVEDFILPVEDKNDLQHSKLTLPGAPTAFVSGENQFIGDTAEIHYPKGLPAEIISDMKAYFKSKEFKSFVSLNIFREGQRLGALNVDSNKPEVFGASEQQREEMMALLSPFCLLLGQILEC